MEWFASTNRNASAGSSSLPGRTRPRIFLNLALLLRLCDLSAQLLELGALIGRQPIALSLVDGHLPGPHPNRLLVNAELGLQAAERPAGAVQLDQSLESGATSIRVLHFFATRSPSMTNSVDVFRARQHRVVENGRESSREKRIVAMCACDERAGVFSTRNAAFARRAGTIASNFSMLEVTLQNR
jgi:hypothetical protein